MSGISSTKRKEWPRQVLPTATHKGAGIPSCSSALRMRASCNTPAECARIVFAQPRLCSFFKKARASFLPFPKVTLDTCLPVFQPWPVTLIPSKLKTSSGFSIPWENSMARLLGRITRKPFFEDENMFEIFPSKPATGKKITPIILNILEIKTLTPSIIPPTLKTLQFLTADPTN